MSTKKRITKILVLSMLAVVVIWDVYVVGWGAADAQDSFSRTILQWVFHKQPALLLPIGYVLGHMFWPQKAPLEDQELYDKASARFTDAQAEALTRSRGFVVMRPKE